MVTVHVSKEILAAGISISIIAAFLALVISGVCKTRKAAAQQEGRRRAPPAAMEADEEVEMGRALLCRYLKADGWPDATCGVCLAELADGDALRVLPPCMHYFHAACVGDWIRVHAACPFCRGPIAGACPV